MLEDKLQTYEGKIMMIEQLEKKSMSAEKSLKNLEDKLRESENVQSGQVENLTRRLESMEHRLSHVDELETKLHKAESRLSLVEELEAKLKAVEKILVKMNIERRDEEMEELSALSEVNDPANIHSKSGNHHSDNQRYESPIDRNVTERKKVQTEQTKGVPFHRLRGLPQEDRVAFSVSGTTNEQHLGQRVHFHNLDFNEGGGFHMSTGTFICPRSGTYFFMSTLSSAGKGYVSSVVKVDGAIKFLQYCAYGHPGDNLSTNGAVVHCRGGDSVWMEIVSGDYVGGGWLTMTGFLLWPDITRQRRFEVRVYLLLDGLPPKVNGPHLPEASGFEALETRLQSLLRFVTGLEVQTSLGISMGYVKSMFESMERKLLLTENHVKLFEDKLQTYEGKFMMIEQLEKKSMSAEKSLKWLEDEIRESENVQSGHVRNLTRRLESMEHRLSHVDELEMKLHKAESRLSLVEELEAKLKAVEKILVKMNIETSDNENDELSALSEAKHNKPANIYSKSGNDNSDNQWYESLIDRNVTEGKKVHTEPTKGVPFHRLRGLPQEDRVAFSVSGSANQQHLGKRILFNNLDFNEGGEFHMSNGTFICPRSGTYFFMATLSSAGKGYVSSVIKIDGANKFQQYCAYGHPGHNFSTGAAVAHCRVGESVWMELTSGDYVGGGWLTMTGFLLWSDS
ncbi:hypothetical protein CHS0354_033388 [Potamilus streckersoni]|uniref:C1q domain-containing protein n=1 Tax=Potamilus streckersoni TaxID=2493646 RepID=A0AAE0RTI8_9BIVA|nr:hypothetical protein CHS0354_033388 [Potamilus streckersoni]